MVNEEQRVKSKEQKVEPLRGLYKKPDCQHRSYQFALDIIRLLDKLPRTRSIDAIASQLIRSATSIGSNIVEAQASPTRKDFANFLNYALKSANETRYWLGLLKDSGQTDGLVPLRLIEEVEALSKMLGSSLLTLRGNERA